jgi:cell division septation protein DedD
VAAQIQDDGFHEIQLNGKQLVFLFMAATVVSVVIFLFGVLVGRGVRAERGAIADLSVASSVAETTPQQPAVAPAPPPAGSDPTAAAQPPAAEKEELTYFDRLEKSKPAKEELKGSRQSPSQSQLAAKPAAEPKAPPAPTPAPARAVADASASEPGGSGFAVQIAALNVKSEADAIAKRLSSKGYAAYVLSPASGSPSVYRVRVGKFSTRREAESIAAKLQKEEQFKPWVTR